jgi:hypothetical protein
VTEWACVQAHSAELRSRADEGTRTPDPLLTMEVLYQLSYVGASGAMLAWLDTVRDVLLGTSVRLL